MINRLLSVTLALGGLAHAQAIVQTPTGPASYKQNQPFQIKVAFTGSGASAGQQFTVFLPTGVTADSCALDTASIAAGKLMDCRIVPGAGLRVLVYGQNKTTINPGGIATLNLTAANNVTLNFTLTGNFSTDPDGSNISTAGGAVSIPFDAGTLSNKCDFNVDGKVDTLDEQLARDQLFSSTFNAARDLNGDGRNDLSDRQIVFNAMNGGACKAI